MSNGALKVWRRLKNVINTLCFVTVYCATKGSEKKFLNKINSTFLMPVDEKISKKQKSHSWMPEQENDQTVKFMLQNHTNRAQKSKIVMFYGDWGKNPNALKGSAPTPGIGLRRRVHQSGIETVTTSEYLTSQTCPCCRERSMKNATITNAVRNPEKEFKQAPCTTKHHLLRCTNEKCCRRVWWHRDNVGSFNILYKGIELARTLTIN